MRGEEQEQEGEDDKEEGNRGKRSRGDERAFVCPLLPSAPVLSSHPLSPPHPPPCLLLPPHMPIHVVCLHTPWAMFLITLG
jgi:hypothetical protein